MEGYIFETLKVDGVTHTYLKNGESHARACFIKCINRTFFFIANDVVELNDLSMATKGELTENVLKQRLVKCYNDNIEYLNRRTQEILADA